MRDGIHVFERQHKPDDDIRLFLSSEFDEIKETHPFNTTIPKSWPPESIIELLVDKSAGQFIFSAAVIKFVASFDHLPHERLKDMLAFCDNNCTSGRILEFLDERPPQKHSYFSFSPTRTISSDNKVSPPLRIRSLSPFPSQLPNTEFQRASSEPSFDSSSGPRRSTSPRRVTHSATHSCPIP